MFLFRKRKENPEIPAEDLKLEETARAEKPAKQVKATVPVKAVKPAGKDIKEKAVKKAEAVKPDKDPFFQSEDSLQIIESDTPVKVVIPASSLIDDMEDEPVELVTAAETAPVSEEAVDGLFEVVNQPQIEEEVDIPLEDILPPLEKKPAPKPVEPAPAAGDKAQPHTPAPAAPAVTSGKPKAEAVVPAQPVAVAKAAVPVETPTQSMPSVGLPGAADSKAESATALASAAGAAAPASGDKNRAKPADEKTLPPAADAAKKPAEENKKKAGGDDKKKAGGEENKENLFSALFGKVEEAEETPLDRLIKTLPEISMEEVMNEAEEVKGLMSEWYQNQPK